MSVNEGAAGVMGCGCGLSRAAKRVTLGATIWMSGVWISVGGITGDEVRTGDGDGDDGDGDRDGDGDGSWRGVRRWIGWAWVEAQRMTKR